MSKVNKRSLLVFGPSKPPVRGVRAYYIIKHLREFFDVKIIDNDVIFPKSILNMKRRCIKNVLRLPKTVIESEFVLLEGYPPGSNYLRSYFILFLLKFLKKRDIKIILDLKDDPILSYPSVFGLSINMMSWEHIRNKTFELSNLILFPSESMRDFYLKKNLIPKETRTVVIMNASDPEHFRFSPLPSNNKIGFVGGITLGKAIELLSEAFILIKKDLKDVTLEIASKAMNKRERKFIEEIRQQYMSKGISFRDDVVYRTAQTFIQNCYLCVIPRKKIFYFDIATPTKLFDYMAVGRPVVVTDCYEMARIVREEKCGLVCDFTPEDMAEKIYTILNDTDLARAFAENGRRAVELRHNWGLRTDTIVKEIKAL